MTRPLVERFWEKVDKNGPLHPYEPHLGRCWLWTDSTLSDGYGRIREGTRSQKTLQAHRVSYVLENGSIPGSLQVRHTCSNPPCVNPTHLSLGTHQDNMNDKVAQGRQSHVSGDQHGSAKLTEEQVAEIRRDYVRGSRTHGQRALGRKYGVVQTTVGYIVRGEHWIEETEDAACADCR